MSNIFPTSYTDKTTLVAGDKVWGYDSEGIANVNFTLLSIYNYLTGSISTSDVPEGTNLYYTNARVDARITGKADKTNVLELDNTTAFTPSTDYEPATKKYVDDNPIAQSTTTVLGGNRILTDAEAIAGTDEVKTANAKQIGFNVVAGNTILATSPTDVVVSSSTTSYTKFKEIEVGLAGTYRVTYQLLTSSVGTVIWYTRIYINGVAVGVERVESVGGQTKIYTDDYTVSAGDLIQLYSYVAATRSGGTIQEFYVGYNTVSKLPTGTVNL